MFNPITVRQSDRKESVQHQPLFAEPTLCQCDDGELVTRLLLSPSPLPPGKQPSSRRGGFAPKYPATGTARVPTAPSRARQPRGDTDTAFLDDVELGIPSWRKMPGRYL